ncbi:MAG: GNAT family N-acetyltransferase [Cohaesibacter sp.]|nr:GNAT family N-acetyltransferase [Cohaesibacter sp.]
MTKSFSSIRPMHKDDAAAILAIYQQGIETGHATFASQAPDWTDWDAGYLPACRFVACDDSGQILGWAALSGVSSRCVYAGVAEVSVYIADHAKGKGVGRSLLGVLIDASEKDGIWTLQAGIFPENLASLSLHEALGFKRLGLREKLGKMQYGPMQDQWRDVVLLERRSTVAGQD